MLPAYFLDTSALLPAYIRRAVGHQWVTRLLDTTDERAIALASITPAELAAAINQLARGGIFRPSSRDAALKEFWRQFDSDCFLTIPIDDTLVRSAADLTLAHPLKGYDAIQLVYALAFRKDLEQTNQERLATGLDIFDIPIFLTEDNRLSQAAAAEGFAVDSPKAHP